MFAESIFPLKKYYLNVTHFDCTGCNALGDLLIYTKHILAYDWSDNQLIVTRHSCKVNSFDTMTILVVEPTTHQDGHAFISHTNRKEAYTSSARTAAVDVIKQSKNLVIQVNVAVKTKHIKVMFYTANPTKHNLQQPHSSLGWRNVPYPSLMYTAIPRARGILRRHKTGRMQEPEYLRHLTHVRD